MQGAGIARAADREIEVNFERAQPAAEAGNHPLAERMGVIAGFSHNIVVGAVFGTFSIMLASTEERLGVSSEAASLGIPLVVIGSSLLASVAGVLVARYSLRRLMAIAAGMAATAFLLLAFTRTYPIYLFAYGVLLGPAIAIAGSVGPATLVTRWFSRNRGLALGIVHVPVVVAVLPMVTNWLLFNHGATAAYLLPAGLIALVVLPLSLLAVDHPPKRREAEARVPAIATDGGSRPLRRIVAMPAFWALAFGGSAVATGAVLLGAVLIPMALSWGLDRPHAAVLATILSLVGIAGSVVFGWLADRLGGARTLALICFDLAILWISLLVVRDFAVIATAIGLIGMHGAGMIPSLGRGLAESCGAAGFSRAFGLAMTVSLPLTVLAVLGTARFYAATGSFSGGIVGMTILYALAAPLTVLVGRNARAVIRA